MSLLVIHYMAYSRIIILIYKRNIQYEMRKNYIDKDSPVGSNVHILLSDFPVSEKNIITFNYQYKLKISSLL